MYLLASNNAISKFPYSLEELRNDNPNTSFPLQMSEEELAEWDVFTVEYQDPPAFNEQTESIELDAPALVDGKWVRGWIVTPAIEEEIENRRLIKADSVRIQRDRALTKTDYTQLNDYSGSPTYQAQIKQLRQALRDVPSQPGFPWDVVWPLPESGSI